MAEAMWLALCAVFFLLGRLCAGAGKRDHPPEAQENKRMERQLSNFWAYDGTEGGQVELED